MHIIYEYILTLWQYLLVSSPYLLLGLFASGVIHHFIPMDAVKKWLGKNNVFSVIKASLVGVPLPLCSCSVIPTAVTLKKSGASNGATSAFLISTPESGVDSISITYALIDLPMTILRPIAAFCSAFVAGLLQFKFNKFEYVSEDEPKVKCCAKMKKNSQSRTTFMEKVSGVFKFGFGKLLNDISFWLTIGILLGALIDFVVPDSFFSNVSDFQSKFLILLIGIPLYICASASTPIAASLMLKGLSPGSAMLFLLVGPATNISNIAVLQKYIGKKGVLLNILSVVVVALGFSFVVDYLYQNYFTLSFAKQLISHEHEASWWQQLSAVVLSLLLVRGLFIEELKPRLIKA